VEVADMANLAQEAQAALVDLVVAVLVVHLMVKQELLALQTLVVEVAVAQFILVKAETVDLV
jgi:hypothetical protein